MTITAPWWARLVIYVITGVGTPVVAYCLARGWIGPLEVELWSAEVTVGAAVAAGHIPAGPPGKV